MRIEIGESLIYSWLRHVQGCVVTQMNWKPSPTWRVAQQNELTEAFEVIRSFASQDIGVQIFKNGDFGQFIRQAEIDVLGLHRDHDLGTTAAIAVDTAFHDNGLQYGNTDETVGRVLKKLIRAAFAIEAYLDVEDADVIFATPKMAEAVREGIQRHLAVLERRMAERRISAMQRLRFRVIVNADFSKEILAPVLEQVDAVADTSELFVRAQQLMRLGDSTARSRYARLKTDRTARATSEERDRIGKHVRATMGELARSGRLTARIVGDLLDARYCKARFNLGYPFLKPVDRTVSLSRQGNDHHGRGRYWKKPLKIGQDQFLMCNNWFVWQRDAFDGWVRDIGLNLAPEAGRGSLRKAAPVWRAFEPSGPVTAT